MANQTPQLHDEPINLELYKAKYEPGFITERKLDYQSRLFKHLLIVHNDISSFLFSKGLLHKVPKLFRYPLKNKLFYIVVNTYSLVIHRPRGAYKNQSR
jgi:hypothetical protein